jgi:hypothetical protein
MTVGELGERMDAAELLAWIERDRTTHSDSWLQTALICHTIAIHSFGGSKAKFKDFLPQLIPAKIPTGPAPGLNARLLAWAAARPPRSPAPCPGPAEPTPATTASTPPSSFAT